MTTPNQYQHLQARLLSERDSLSRRIHALAGGLHIEQAAESLDEVANRQMRDATAGDLARLRETAAEVECAIARWNLDVYGVCVACDGPIAAKRLEAIPWAANCNSCQSKIERRHV